MSNLPNPSEHHDRRAFLGRAATAALGIGASATALREALAAPVDAQGADRWLSGLKGKYRQLTDIFEPNDGFGFAYAHIFLATQGPQPDASAVVVLRHGGFPFALSDAIWERYKIGQAMKINDPATKAPAVKNPFFRQKPGALLVDDMAIDRLLGRGVIFGACNIALQVQSGMLASQAGVTAEVALKEWTAGIIPGITVIPSGVWGVNRAQMAGCTYCSGG
ncbi:MAG: hypothetical protein IT361_10065 [Gemmatimonadaceae bacterium]|nr:hypothetical protein [Gemmatimonadaceae bacterium]